MPAGLLFAEFVWRSGWMHAGVGSRFSRVILALQRCAHARLAPHHCSDSLDRIFSGSSERARRAHELVWQAAPLISPAKARPGIAAGRLRTAKAGRKRAPGLRDFNWVRAAIGRCLSHCAGRSPLRPSPTSKLNRWRCRPHYGVSPRHEALNASANASCRARTHTNISLGMLHCLNPPSW
jgi:hypothetical protein